MQTMRVSACVLSGLLLVSAGLAQQPDKKAAAPGGAVDVGQPAPDFQLLGHDGKNYKLSDLKDKVVVLEWIDKECPFSKGVLPKTKETSGKYAGKGVVWLAIDSNHKHDSAGNVAYVKEHTIPYPILMDTDGKVGRAYGAKTTPHMFIINKGKLVYMGAIDNKGDRSYVAEALDAILAGKDVPSPKTQPYGCSVKYKG